MNALKRSRSLFDLPANEAERVAGRLDRPVGLEIELERHHGHVVADRWNRTRAGVARPVDRLPGDDAIGQLLA